MKILTRQHFKLPVDPWAGWTCATADQTRVADLIKAAVAGDLFVSIIGPRGSGKTQAARHALANCGDGARVVEPLRLTRDKLHMGDIETALVVSLADESPRRSGEARSRQVRRILGAASRARKIVLFIDDAHVLHSQTLRALKRLRELSFAGRAPLLSVILAAQRDKTASIPEVGLRADALSMGGLAKVEVSAALRGAGLLDGVLTHDAELALAAAPAAGNWLDLRQLVDDCLFQALAAGARQVDAVHVRAAMRAAPTASAAPAADAGDPAAGAALDDYLAQREAA